ncbi:glycosyltransferase [Donghicola sp. C2-DW-16]|uniref:Glycosyltransferase n=1 Tax=Donghicola mangrovi TaxID=2729614 RepID=A0ABX2P9N6_9RHOB|nr:glycosyltransferase [Donghicola mangrovi]NVO26183.1 glycosyltransferase [Donghicola mangrovi]
MEPSASVVVVSQGREALLARCLMALSQQQKVRMEVVVVTSDPAIQYLAGLGWADRVKLVRMNDENISVARNKGINEAAGDIVAFIDDDAVPEPAWLYLILQAFQRPEVEAATGFTLGRNGISYQWKAETIDAAGVSHPLEVPEDTISVFTSTPDRVIKTVGTNMAFRRDMLRRLGGFDPRYRFYLDEGDLNMRMAQEAVQVAVVPMARVHHAFAPSRRRTEARVPKTLYEIGASQALFVETYMDQSGRNAAMQHFRGGQLHRLLQLLQNGLLGPEEVSFLNVTLSDGISDGRKRSGSTRTILEKAKSPIRPLVESLYSPVQVICGRIFERKGLLMRGKQAASEGEIPIVIELSPSALYHQCYYDERGFWVQYGGIWGKSLRSQPNFRFSTFSARIDAETRRLLREFWLEPDNSGT